MEVANSKLEVTIKMLLLSFQVNLVRLVLIQAVRDLLKSLVEAHLLHFTFFENPDHMIALLLSGIMVLKKLMSAKSGGGGGGGGHESHGWSSGGSSGGWDRRSYDDLAYSAYKRE